MDTILKLLLIFSVTIASCSNKNILKSYNDRYKSANIKLFEDINIKQRGESFPITFLTLEGKPLTIIFSNYKKETPSDLKTKYTDQELEETIKPLGKSSKEFLLLAYDVIYEFERLNAMAVKGINNSNHGFVEFYSEPKKVLVYVSKESVVPDLMESGRELKKIDSNWYYYKSNGLDLP